MLELEKKQSREFRRDYIGRNAEVLFEESKEIDGVLCQVGYTGEYVRAARKTDENLSGKTGVGRLAGFAEDDLLWLE